MRKPPFVRSPYNYDTAEASNDGAVEEWLPSMTQQSMAEESDINNIVKRFGLTGVLPQNVRVPSYGDFTEVNDYTSAMQAIKSAESSFNAMPSEVRARFENSPQKFLQFCADRRNLDEMREMGLAVPKEPDNGDGKESSGSGGRGGLSVPSSAEGEGQPGRSEQGVRGADAGGARRGGESGKSSP